MTLIYILIPVFLLGIFVANAQNTSKFKYLFRNTIVSNSQKYELAPVLRGRVYYPRYFYIPSLKQYMVYSNVEENGSVKLYHNKTKLNEKVYSLLDENGNILETFATPLSFSNRSGCFYGPNSYIPFLETGKTTNLQYDKVYNAALDLNKRDFEKLFIQLYTSAEYIEFVNLRVLGDDIHEAGIIFKRQGKIEILLSGVRDSRMTCKFLEDRKTSKREDYYQPNIPKKETFPESEPSIEMISLKTTDINPYAHWRMGLYREFAIKKYINTYSSDLESGAKLLGIPIYLPGEASGTVYVRFKTKGETFRIKILEVEKFGLNYNLGLRTFQLPATICTKNSLIFMESLQNGGESRLGGGVFVVRPNTKASADIPSDITEEHFNTLPIPLQEALMNPDKATSLKLYEINRTGWIPEIEKLKNLTRLEITMPIGEIPDGISKLNKLQELILERCDIHKISPRLAELTDLTYLNISSNKLTEFPPVLLELKNLKRLNIGANKISSLPDDITKLEQLENLDMVLTNITTLPSSMINMKKLYIYDGRELENKLPAEYKPLFDYMKNRTEKN